MKMNQSEGWEMFPNITSPSQPPSEPQFEVSNSNENYNHDNATRSPANFIFTTKMSNNQTRTNVPQGSGAPAGKKSTPHKSPSGHAKTHQQSALMTAKHVQPQNKKSAPNGKAPSSPPKQTSPASQTSSQSSSLMQMLFAATEKQQQPPAPLQKQSRTRKATAPNMNSSAIYAGAAFDRAPTGESFPIPSFLAKGSNDDSMLSASCPLPSGPLSKRVAEESKADISPIPNSRERETALVLKSLSIQDLLGSSQPSTPSKPQVATSQKSSPSPPSKSISVSQKSQNSKQKQQDLNNLTQDLRRMLNLSK